VGEQGAGRGGGTGGDSAALRTELLASIRSRRQAFQAAGDRAQELRTLPPDTVATLRSIGVFWLKTPAELGGTPPLAPLDFCDVMEELAYADTSTAWTAMVGNGGTGTAGGWLPRPPAGRHGSPVARGSASAAFHSELGRAQTKLRAARLAHREAVEAAWAGARARNGMLETVHIAVAAASVGAGRHRIRSASAAAAAGARADGT
jgi:Acyl-CoA dehydrogenase, N-terminal domain